MRLCHQPTVSAGLVTSEPNSKPAGRARQITAALPLLVVLVVSVLLVACGGRPIVTPEEAAEITGKALAPREVRLTEAEVRPERPVIELVGEIRAFETVRVPAEVAGKIDRVLVEVGERVDRGAPMLEIDRETFRLQVAQASAELAAASAELTLAAKDLERKRDLVSDHTIPQSTFDQVSAQHDLAAARVKAAQATVDLAERNLGRSEVKAPDAGWIARRLVAPGDWADIGMTMVELATGSKVKVVGRLPESWAARLDGLTGFEFRAGEHGAVRTAKLFSIDPVLEDASRSFEIVGTVADGRAELRPGMFATITLTSPVERTSLWLPTEAVLVSNLPQVLFVDGEHVASRNVTTGRRAEGMVEIVSGLEPGEPVIAEVAGLHRGAPVKVIG